MNSIFFDSQSLDAVLQRHDNPSPVIPAKAGIQCLHTTTPMTLDAVLQRHDNTTSTPVIPA